MTRRMFKVLVPGLVFAAGLYVAQPAQAQSPPPPVAPCAANGTVDLGVHNLGEVLSRVLCGPWLPATPVALTYDGRAAGSKGALADGSITGSVALLSLAQNAVDDVVPGQCGVNTLVGTGTAFIGTGTATAGFTFTLNCVNGVPTSVSSAGTTISPTLNSQQQQQQQQQKVTVEGAKSGTAAPGTATAAATATAGGAGTTPGTGGGRVAFTGANVLRMTVAALAMVGVGALLLLRSRRRAGLTYQ